MKSSYNPRQPARTNFYHQDAMHRNLSGIFVGIVKRVDDGQCMGRLSVWIPELGGAPTLETCWIIVSYASPFAGATSPNGPNGLIKDAADMDHTQKSYGFWMEPPDLDNQVLCCFINGNLSNGYWFACLYQQNMNHMVPGLPIDVTTEPKDQQLRAGSLPPVVEYNKWSNQNPNSPQRPVFAPLDQGLSAQGLYPDPERGPSSSGVRRESPSKVFGWLTPRGNSVHVDDNPANEFIRLRTRSGAQVLIHETTGYVYINSKEGNSWIEVSDKGVDIYSEGAVSLRSQGDMNLKADGALNLEADGNLNLRAGGNLTLQSAHQTDIAGNGHLALQFGGVASTKAGGGILLDSGGALRLGAGGDLTMSSSGNNIRSASAIFDNTGNQAPAPNAPAATVPAPGTLPDVTGTGPAYTAANSQTIGSRMPTHEPFVNHPKGGDTGPGMLTAKSFASTADSADVNANGAPVVASPDIANVVGSDLDWLACCMIDEAANQGNDGLAAVAQVIKNRIATHTNSDGTIKGTVLAKDQFSGFYHATVNGKYQRVCSDIACATQRGLQKMATYEKSSGWTNARNIGSQVMGGTYNGSASFQAIKANKRCVNYLNIDATKKLNFSGLPGWAQASNHVATINAHDFYTV